MKVLLLNLYYPPDTSATAKMAQIVTTALSEHHEVTVLCGRPSYDPTERRRWKPWQTETVNGTRIVRVGSTDYSRAQMKRRVFNYLTYVALAVPRALFVQCDVILAMTDPPFEGIVGAFIAMLKGKPYVYNIRDMYPDMAVAGSIVDPGLLPRVWEILHRWALRHVSSVIVLGEDMRARMIAKGVDPSHIEIVRDGADIEPENGPLPSLDPDVIGKIRGDSKFVLVHAGNLGFYGAWNTLITGAKALCDKGVSLVFVGDGAQRAQLEALANGCTNVRFLPFFPSSKIPSVLAAADAHVITVKRGLEGVVVPSKMYGILAAGKPIVAVAPKETDAALLGERLGFSVCADPDHPEELVTAVCTLIESPGLLETMGKAARAAAPGYDRVKELQKFVQIIGRYAAGEKIQEARQA